MDFRCVAAALLYAAVLFCALAQDEGGYCGSSGPLRYNASAGGLYTSGIPVCAAGAPATASCFTADPRQGYWSGSAAVSTVAA